MGNKTCISSGKTGKEACYDSDNKEEEKKAKMYVWEMNSNEYDKFEAEVQATLNELNAKVPAVLRNLMWVDTEKGSEMFYVDEQGKRTDKPVDLSSISEALKGEMARVTEGDEVTIVTDAGPIRLSRAGAIDSMLSKVV